MHFEKKTSKKTENTSSTIVLSKYTKSHISCHYESSLHALSLSPSLFLRSIRLLPYESIQFQTILRYANISSFNASHFSIIFFFFFHIHIQNTVLCIESNRIAK